MKQRKRRHENSEAQKLPWIELRHDDADQRHGDERSDSARRHSDARLERRIAEKRLQQNGQDDQAAVKHEAEHGHQENAGGVSPLAKDLEADDGVRRGEFLNEEECKANDGDYGQRRNPVRSEPVGLLPAVKHHLKRADTHRQHSDAPGIHLRRAAADVGRVEQEKLGHDDGSDADRDVDVEDPAPGIAVRKPAAEHWPEHGRDHDAEPPKSHGLAAVLGTKRFEQNRLRNGLQATSAGPLKDSEKDQGRKIPGEPAEK